MEGINMKRKLIAVTLAALPMVAMADVTLYGDLKASLESDTVSGQATQNKVQDNTSLLGFKGAEDLGNGLKTIWQVENRIYMDGSSNSGFDSRQTFVGLDGGDWGQVRLGYINNALNDQYTVDQWQYGSDVTNFGKRGAADYTTISGANGLSVFTNSGDRLKNAFRYDSANFYGLSASLGYGFGENKTQNGRPDGSTSASDIASIGVNYSYQDIVSAHYAVQRESNPISSINNNDDRAANKSLFEVDFNDFNWFASAAYQISTGYDWVDDFSGDGDSVYAAGALRPDTGTGGLTPAAAHLKASQAAFSLAYTWGAFTPKVSYAKGWNEQVNGSTIDNSGYRQYILGVDYAFSKRTTAGVSYGNLQFDKNTAVAQGDNPGSDATLKAVAFTLAHSF
jgi:predicted porin